ncbi:MAG: DHA2 family efflux MFS transporter permease subunit [Candidatus Lambdaproteobacteria bacterium]|nr:DHA2 family efflux MFS transporter permease subunit [Candidatus Lambdaproteobacteria bacterium]
MATTPGDINRWFILTTVMGGTFLSHLDNSAVNIALPHIMVSFGATVQQAKWVITAAMLTAAVAMPTTGWLARRIGFGPTFLLSLSVFVAGAAFSTLSWNLWSLIAARVFQSLGSGTIQAISMAIVTRTFPLGERGQAMGVWGAGIMVGSALGPASGGFFTDWFGWRSIFAVNVPVGLMLLLAGAIVLPRDRTTTALPFDWLGFLSFATFAVAMLLTVDNGQEQGWTSTVILSGAALSLGALLLFLVQEWESPAPMMPFRLFQRRDFVLALILSSFRSLALFGPVFLIPLFLQRVQGRDALDAGLLIVPSALSMVFTMPIAGALADRAGGRWPTVAGFALSALCISLFGWLDPLTTSWEIAHIQTWRGIGMALIIAPLNTIAMNAVRHDDAGYASWMLNVAQRYSGAVSVAVLSLLLHRWQTFEVDRMGGSRVLGESPNLGLVYEAHALGYSRRESATVARAVLRVGVTTAATTIAYQKLFLASGLFALLGVVPALLLSPRKASGPAAASHEPASPAAASQQPAGARAQGAR